MRKNRTPRYRNWVAVLYTENLKDTWKSEISGVLPCPFAYCVHQPEEESLKEHVHVMMIFNGSVSEKNIKSLLASLDKDVTKPACASKIQRVLNVKSMYDYLIHADMESVMGGKIQYDSSSRICGNGFNIEDYDQNLKKSMKNKRLMWLLDVIMGNAELIDFPSLYAYLKEHRASELDRYVNIIQKNVVFISKFLDGNRDSVFKGDSVIYKTRELHENAPKLNETIEDRELVGEA